MISIQVFGVRCFCPFMCLSLLLGGLQAASASQLSYQDDRPKVKIMVSGAPSLVFDSASSGCDRYDTPDAPARAFRDQTGLIHFFSSALINRQSTGNDLLHLKHSCKIAFVGSNNGNPSSYNDYGWLASFYPIGSTTYALVHNEFHGHEHSQICHSKVYELCWDNSITSAVSNDGGYKFFGHVGGAGLVASLPYRYSGDKAGPVGYFSPSNIVFADGFFYALLSIINRVKANVSGVCVIRTRQLGDPSSWRAWDGSDFKVELIDPYEYRGSDPTAHLCAPVGAGKLLFSLGSVLWSVQAKTFVVTMRLQNWDHAAPGEGPGAYYATSPDLVHWSRRALLMEDSAAGQTQQAQLYPSVIDPSSKSVAFATLGDRALLYTVTAPSKCGNKAWNLWSRAISVQSRSDTARASLVPESQRK